MRAFHNDEKVQKMFLDRIHGHAKADDFIKGKYWEGGKGCAVGCSIHGSNHKDYETEMGVPEWLARVEDCFFENLPNEQSRLWPVQFMEAINLGADLDKIKAPFMIYILSQSLLNFDHEKYPNVKKSIKDTIDLWEKHSEGPSAAESAAWSVARSAARSAAESAARSAAWSARSAAWSAESAARSAAWSAESAAYIKYSEKLLELMRGCK